MQLVKSFNVCSAFSVVRGMFHLVQTVLNLQRCEMPLSLSFVLLQLDFRFQVILVQLSVRSMCKYDTTI